LLLGGLLAFSRLSSHCFGSQEGPYSAPIMAPAQQQAAQPRLYLQGISGCYDVPLLQQPEGAVQRIHHGTCTAASGSTIRQHTAQRTLTKRPYSAPSMAPAQQQATHRTQHSSGSLAGLCLSAAMFLLHS
jgi:hypothetical protein